MKKFEFTLSKMLDYKDQVLDKEKNALMQLRNQKNKIDEKILSLENEAVRVGNQYQEESQKGITAIQIRCYDFQLENIRRQVAQLKQEQKVMAIAVERQLQVVIALSQEVSGLDKLQEKQLEEYNYLQARADETFISEYISGNLIRQKQA